MLEDRGRSPLATLGPARQQYSRHENRLSTIRGADETGDRIAFAVNKRGKPSRQFLERPGARRRLMAGMNFGRLAHQPHLPEGER